MSGDDAAHTNRVPTSSQWADALWLAARAAEAAEPEHRARAPDGGEGEAPLGPQSPEPPAAVAPPAAVDTPALPAPEPPPRHDPGPSVPKAPVDVSVDPLDGPASPVGPSFRLSEQSGQAAPTLVRDRLDQRLVERTLRPLDACTDSASTWALDEETTARTAAATGRWIPRTRPERVRRFRLLSVREDSLTMRFHAPVLDQFDRLLSGRGIFADVRHLRLRPRGDGPERPSAAEAAEAAEWNAADHVIAASDPGAVLLVATDGLSSEWRSGRFQRRLARWSSRHLVALLNVHPRGQWRRTWLDTRRARLSRPRGGVRGDAVPNTRLTARLTDPGERPPFVPPPHPGATPVPVLSFPDGLEDFALFASGARVPGGFHTRVLPVSPYAAGPDAGGGPAGAADFEESAEQAVGRFRAEASEAAFRLVRALAAVPLSLPVVQAVRRAVVPEADRMHVAEVMASGLLRWEERGADGRPALEIAQKAREVLLSLGRRSDTLRALRAWALAVRGELPWSVSFEAALEAPSARGSLLQSVPGSAVPAAKIVLDSLRSASGVYLRMAAHLRSALDSEVPVPMRSDSPPVRAQALLDADVVVAADEPDADAVLPDAPVELPDDSTPHNDTGVDPLAAARSVSPQAVTRHRPSDPPPVWSPEIPQKNRTFIGRAEELEQLHRRLEEGTTSLLPEAVWGMGGVGKTQLAVEYLYRHQDEYDLVWWVPASSTGEMMRSLSDLARTLELPVGASPDQAVPAVLEALRRGAPYRDWLLVYDNADSPQMVQDFLPSGGPGRVLITSRNRDWERTTRAMEVDVFEREESRELILLRRPDLSGEEADRVAEVLGHLPLAVEQAAVWLLQTGMDTDDYLEAFEAESESLLDIPGLTEYGRPVTAAWNLSLSRLEDKNPAASRLLRICSHLAPVPVPKRYFKSARGAELPPEVRSTLNSPVALNAALRDIGQLSLARLDHRDGSLQMHRLVQQSLRYRMTEEERAEARHQAHLILAAVDPEAPENPSEWPTYAEMLPHIRAAEVHDSSEPWVRNLTVNVASFLNLWGDLQGAVNVAQRALDLWGGPTTDAQVLGAADVLMEAKRRLGVFQEAQELNEDLRTRLLEERGLQNEDTLHFTGLLSYGKRIEGDFFGSYELSKEAWEGGQRLLGPDDPIALRLAHLHGVALRHLGRIDEALEMDRATYENFQEVLGLETPLTNNSGVAIGVDLFTLGRYSEGEAWLRRQVEIISRVFGPDSTLAYGPRGVYSVALYRAGRAEEAVEEARAVHLHYVTREGGHRRSVLEKSAGAYMMALRAAGRFEEALEAGKGLLETQTELFGERHPDTRALQANWAMVCRSVGRLDEARRLAEAAYQGLYEALGEEHSYVPAAAIGLANSMAAQGDLSGAVERDRSTLELARRTLGERHPVTLAAERNLLCGEAGREGADPAVRLEGLRALYAEVHGEQHPLTQGLARGEREERDIYTPAL
ncbi:FxSxx-COOH system tetratricopeptide repeat protein [Nocardiopsis suaedae]|uniref:FxSxx-COOH system tetratricopeptide repeat protein n=1 Tax=Nocardiopsis suaedae TaxID=3018444 RepID=A0ABT4TMA6_9ACTN|nr:FxSxx-COOH system tetratricopeptide repeat protein [Nocardiopsis suaedae]MDA2805823.1 FxSxx-COOH system tetratricopeptide repeat protein [Nocardiopsis suaedae]